MPTSSDVRIVTLGCRLNTNESEIMQGLARKAGLTNTIIINTCSVTAEAERQARQTIRSLRKDNPDAYLIATGCAVQMRPQIFSEMPEIDRLLGNDIKLDPDSFSKEFAYRTKIGKISAVTALDIPLVAQFNGRAKAFLQIQNGCDHRCAFCTIPLARGKSRSVALGAIVNQARSMLEQGVQEIVLTGVDITSYGKGLPGDLTLGKMVKRLLMQLPELKRLRLSSLDSIEIDAELLTLLCEEPRLLPHLHLSLQAGHNTILKAMRRRHTTELAVDLCQTVHQRRPEFVIGADFIVGFPGETEEMFAHTLQTVMDCGLTHLHVFPFSKRPGTLAERMPDQVPTALIKERAYRLRQIGQERKMDLFKKHVGKEMTVLVEQCLKGHTNDFSPVHFSQDMALNTLIKATITGYGPEALCATL